MAETAFATLQRKQIEATVGELLLTDDFYMRLELPSDCATLLPMLTRRWIGRN